MRAARSSGFPTARHTKHGASAAVAVAATLLLIILSAMSPTCVAQPGNLALGRPVYASSNYVAQYPPRYAVDGNPNSFMHTAFEDRAKWLSVDLGGLYSISRIRLWNRQNCCPDRMANAQVRVGVNQITGPTNQATLGWNQLVWTQPGTGSTTVPYYDIVLSPPAVGRWVTVQNGAGSSVLAVGELEVYNGTARPAACPRTNGWCGYQGGTFSQFDCDGDGILDLVCTDIFGRRAAVLSSKGCLPGQDGWPNAPVSLCPAKFGGNLAKGKTAYASSNYINNTQYGPGNAVDGNKDSFMQTDPADSARWLSVDLGGLANISRIVLWNRASFSERLANAEMRVGTWPIRTTNDTGAVANNPLVWQQNGGGSGAVPAYQVVFSTPVVGRWITVQNFRSGVDTGEAVLAIGELEVYGNMLNANSSAVCPTQPGWCEYPGSIIEMVNCDNDSIMDLVCTDVYGRRGVRLSSKSCASDDASTGWPMASSSLCPAKIPVNVALGKTAYASSNYVGQFPASYAVDGNMTTFMQTAVEDAAKWLSVDLGSVMNVTRIVLWNRQDCCQEQLANAEVRAGSTVIWSSADYFSFGQNPIVWRQAAAPAPPTPWYSWVIYFSQPTAVRCITVQNGAGGSVLTIGEIEVFTA